MRATAAIQTGAAPQRTSGRSGQSSQCEVTRASRAASASGRIHHHGPAEVIGGRVDASALRMRHTEAGR